MRESLSYEYLRDSWAVTPAYAGWTIEMSTISETSDAQILDLLRQCGPMSIAQLIEATSVTANAVRQRLTRLTTQGLVEREVFRGSRGRPGHRYRLTEKARRQTGSNFADLAVVLWEEIRAVKDAEVRRGLLARIAAALGGLYAGQVKGTNVAERMHALAELFDRRGVPIEVRPAEPSDGLDRAGNASQRSAGPVLPVLRVLDCPYPDLVERDRGICAVEKMLFAELLDHDVRLSQCRLDGHACCEFSSN
jgi:DeoR family suf operon transcriptional repressor